VTGLPIELNPIMLASCLSGCDLTLSLDSISFDTLGFATVTVGAEGSSQINIIEWMSLADSTIYPYAQELTFTTSEAGDFMITVTDLMGCTYSLVVSVIFDGLEGVDNPTALKFGLYPNPSNGFMNISFSKTIHQVDIKVIDMQGRIVFSLNNTSSLNESLDLNHLNSGTYFVSVSSDEGFAKTKILIQK
jgi:hypothetical protein